MNGKRHKGEIVCVNNVCWRSAEKVLRLFSRRKSRREKELMPEQKWDNRTVSSFRVRVEHAIGSIKRYRTVKYECRLKKLECLCYVRCIAQFQDYRQAVRL
ncbi:MAG: hypothetical protein LBL07_10240 [Tannerella sp.]|nr:hypothetical protein [Tannerella sp.]